MDEQVNLEECRSLDEISGVAQLESSTPVDPDEASITTLAESLSRTPSGRQVNQEKLTQLAEDLYAAFCHRVINGQASQQEIERMATLLDETPEQLAGRLRD